MKTTIAAVMILIIWNWGLTPIWVNVISTIFLGLAIMIHSIFVVCKFYDMAKEGMEE